MKVRLSEDGYWGLVISEDRLIQGLKNVMEQRGLLGEYEGDIKNFEMIKGPVAIDLSFVDEIEKIFKDYLKAIREKRKAWKRYIVFSIPAQLVYVKGEPENPIQKVVFVLAQRDWEVEE